MCYIACTFVAHFLQKKHIHMIKEKKMKRHLSVRVNLDLIDAYQGIQTEHHVTLSALVHEALEGYLPLLLLKHEGLTVATHAMLQQNNLLMHLVSGYKLTESLK